MKMRSTIAAFLLSVVVLNGVPDASAESRARPIRGGDLHTSESVVGILFFYLPNPAGETRDAVRDEIKARLPRIKVTIDDEGEGSKPFVNIAEEGPKFTEFRVPSAQFILARGGRNFSNEMISGIEGTTRITRLVMKTRASDVWDYNRELAEAARAFAARSNAVIFDISSNEIFSVETWEWMRCKKWTEGSDIPDVPAQVSFITMKDESHAGRLRVVTRGMEKFALPDFCVDDLDNNDVLAARSLLDLIVQTVAENPKVKDTANFVVDVKAIQHEGLRSRLQDLMNPGADGRAPITLVKGSRPNDGVDNPMIAIDFRAGRGSSDEARRADIFARLWGTK